MFLNKLQISRCLNISNNFLFLNSCKINKKKKTIYGEFKISKKNWIFSSHLIDEPIFPGTLIAESLCQTAMVMIYKKITNKSNRGYLSSINISFKKKIHPKLKNLTFKTEAKEIFSSRGVSIFKVKITCRNKKIIYAEGEIKHFNSKEFLPIKKNILI
jgi:3-hydroxymyristoyl/3-hydroxydecanoyl-(acyl carrier protein) dehydratase